MQLTTFFIFKRGLVTVIYFDLAEYQFTFYKEKTNMCSETLNFKSKLKAIELILMEKTIAENVYLHSMWFLISRSPDTVDVIEWEGS